MLRITTALAVLVITLVPSISSADADVPEFDPSAPINLDEWDGNEWPDEREVASRFEQQYPQFDACVAAEKERTGKVARLAGDAQMALLLNPDGARPLGVNAAMPNAYEKRTDLTRCLRRATAGAQYPQYDGPPLVVEFEFEIDPGEEWVEE